MFGMNGWCKEIPGGDLISRAAVLEELADLYWTEERFLTFKDVDSVFDRIKALPSAQPEKRTNECTETHACDCISRREAIDALDVLCQEHRYRIPGKMDTYSEYNEAWQDALGRAEGAIFNLPSVQPTINGYDIRHLELIAAVLQKENLPPERVTETLTDIGSIVAIVTEEFEETLRKAVEQCMT